jgi:eukaryotic-like serine/threonine-protein kinase
MSCGVLPPEVGVNRNGLLVVSACVLAGIAAAIGRVGPAKGWVAVGIAAAVAVLTPLAGLLIARAKTRLEGRDAAAEQISKTVLQLGGRLPLVRKMTDPVLIGVHPAAGDHTARVPPYVPRDKDGELKATLRTAGFTLVVGEASAGKTRAAFEAMRAALPDHTLLVPSAVGDVTAAVSKARGERNCVLWLDDLQAFLRGGNITRKDIAELLVGDEHHRVILATMHAVDESRLTGRLADEEPPEQLLDIGQGVLDLVSHRIFLDRLFSAGEQERARQLAGTDERIMSALAHAAHTGIAEYLAWGPQLYAQWEDAWARGNRPRGAALITAAVDCRRAGFTGSLPRELLTTLHEDYLREHGGTVLVPEDLDTAWNWALALRKSGSAPLRLDDKGNCDVFGYLVDECRRRDGEVAPERTVRAALDHAGPVDAGGIAATAWEHRRPELARSALQRQYAYLSRVVSADDPVLLAVRVNLLVTRLRQDGYRVGLPEAERECREILTALASQASADPDWSSTVRGKLANVLFARGMLAQAEAEYREVVMARTAGLGEEHPRTLISRTNLALLLIEMDRLQDAEAELRAVMEIRRRTLGPGHPHTLAGERNLASVLRRQANGG